MNLTYDTWYTAVIDAFTNKFYKANMKWLSEYNSGCSNLFESLYNAGFEPAEAARIIEQTKK